jgi:hypothetical protein
VNVLDEAPRLSIKKDSTTEIRSRVGDDVRWAVCVRVPLPREAGGEAIISSGVPPDVCASCGRATEAR